MAEQQPPGTNGQKKPKVTIMVVRNQKNAAVFDGIVAQAKKLGCSVSGLMSAAIERLMSDPPSEVPEIAKGRVRTDPAGFWVIVELDDNKKPKKISVQEVAARSDVGGEEFYKYKTEEEKATALEQATAHAQKLAQWTGVKMTKKDIKTL
ncbi:MAG: hypothetical protein GF414_00595 [Candidatus Altiarchaeales archaeon]|nr:hypothetical protein [Candidatus Altiarchaeales archaeon]